MSKFQKRGTNFFRRSPCELLSQEKISVPSVYPILYYDLKSLKPLFLLFPSNLDIFNFCE